MTPAAGARTLLASLWSDWGVLVKVDQRHRRLLGLLIRRSHKKFRLKNFRDKCAKHFVYVYKIKLSGLSVRVRVLTRPRTCRTLYLTDKAAPCWSLGRISQTDLQLHEGAPIRREAALSGAPSIAHSVPWVVKIGDEISCSHDLSKEHF